MTFYGILIIGVKRMAATIQHLAKIASCMDIGLNAANMGSGGRIWDSPFARQQIAPHCGKVTVGAVARPKDFAEWS
jgi:hypothetical protein